MSMSILRKFSSVISSGNQGRERGWEAKTVPRVYAIFIGVSTWRVTGKYSAITKQSEVGTLQRTPFVSNSVGEWSRSRALETSSPLSRLETQTGFSQDIHTTGQMSGGSTAPLRSRVDLPLWVLIRFAEGEERSSRAWIKRRKYGTWLVDRRGSNCEDASSVVRA